MDREWREFFKEIFSIVIIAFILAMLLRTFVVEARVIPTGSMIPTIVENDRVLVCKFNYLFKGVTRGDIIVFKPPEELHQQNDFIKRVIALPGDKVQMKNQKVYINDKALKEPYIKEPVDYEWGPEVVPAGKILVLGDNRNNSLDSHKWSVPWLDQKSVKGKAFATYWPLGHMKLLQREVGFE